MARYSLTLNSLLTGTTANTLITIAGLKFANTAGHRGWLRRMVIGGSGVAAQDLQCVVRIDRTGNTTDGTATSVLSSIMQADANSIASRVTAAGSQYTVEPTTYAGLLGFGGFFNTRSTLVLEWGPGELLWGSNQTLGIKAAMCTGVAAAGLGLSLEWDE